MNTRRFPRTLNDAFPSDSWRGVVTHYKRPLANRVWDVIFVTVLAAAAGVALFYGLSS